MNSPINTHLEGRLQDLDPWSSEENFKGTACSLF